MDTGEWDQKRASEEESDRSYDQKLAYSWFLPQPPWQEANNRNLYHNGFEEQKPKPIQQVTASAQKTATAQLVQHQHQIEQHTAGLIIPISQTVTGEQDQERASEKESDRSYDQKLAYSWFLP